MTLKNVEKLEKSQVKLAIHVSAEELEEGKAAAFKKNGKSITVPGFRKGKAPRKMIEKLYGEGVFFEDAVNICYPKAYDKAIIEANITPVDVANIEITDINEEGFTFEATVAVEPEVTIGEYKGLSAEKDIAKVTATDVKNEIKNMAERAATTQTVKRSIKDGDIAVIDFEGFVDDKPFEGGKGENHNLVIGSGSFIPGFEEQLIGSKAGDEVDVLVTFPEDYHAEDLKGKAAVFKCKVNEVKEKVLPKLDDELAKDISEFETLDELKNDVEAKLLESRTSASEHEFEEKLMDKVLETLEGEIPEVMFERQVDRLVEDFSYRIQSQGMNLEQYVQLSGMEMSSFRQLFRDQAERQVKVSLALKQIVKKESIEIDSADVEAEYAKMAESYGIDVTKVRDYVPEETITSDLKMNKAFALIKDSAKTTKKKATTKKTTKKSDTKTEADSEKESTKKTTKNKSEKAE